MLQLTKRSEYGLIALVHLADREGEYVSSREIAERYSVPRRLLAEVLKELCRARLVSSARGASGGYSLARASDAIGLGEIVTALEGAPSLTECEALGLYRAGSCEIEPVCPIRTPIHRLRAGIWSLLQRTTLRDLADGSAATLPETVAHGSTRA